MPRSCIVLLSLVLLSSCAPASNSPAPKASPSYEGAWELVSGRGPDGEIPVAGGHPTRLELAGNQVRGNAACNSYGGRVEIDGTSFASNGFSVTEIGCARKLMRSEARYLDALVEVDSIRVVEGVLRLSGPGVQLDFERIPPVPTASLVDTRWKLETILLGRGPEGTAMSAGPGSLELSSDGSFEAVAGCEALIGRWAERAGRVVLTESSSERRCRARDPQDLDVIASLSEGFTVSIEGDELTVRGGGRGLVYRAAPTD